MEFIEIGVVTKPQGIAGEIKVHPYTDDIQRFCDLKSVFLEQKGNKVNYEVESVRVNANAAYLQLAGVDTRNDAELLRGVSVWVDRAHAVELPEGSYFICDLIGMRVTADGKDLGVLADVLQYGAADVYVVKTSQGKLSFPALKRVIKKVDPEQKHMELDAAALEEVAIHEN